MLLEHLLISNITIIDYFATIYNGWMASKVPERTFINDLQMLANTQKDEWIYENVLKKILTLCLEGSKRWENNYRWKQRCCEFGGGAFFHGSSKVSFIVQANEVITPSPSSRKKSPNFINYGYLFYCNSIN